MNFEIVNIICKYILGTFQFSINLIGPDHLLTKMDDWVYELLTNEKVGSAELFKDNSAKKNQNGQMMDY